MENSLAKGRDMTLAESWAEQQERGGSSGTTE